MRSSHSARYRKIAEPAPTAGPVEAIVPLIDDRKAAARKAAKPISSRRQREASDFGSSGMATS